MNDYQELKKIKLKIIGGWRKNIQAEFAKVPGFIPEQKENATCNVKWFNSNQNT